MGIWYFKRDLLAKTDFSQKLSCTHQTMASLRIHAQVNDACKSQRSLSSDRSSSSSSSSGSGFNSAATVMNLLLFRRALSSTVD